MELANTKTVRRIVNAMVGRAAKYTDKGATAGTRYLAWEMYDSKEAEQLVKQIRELFLLAGFSNKVRARTSRYNELARSGGYTYLRITASFVE